MGDLILYSPCLEELFQGPSHSILIQAIFRGSFTSRETRELKDKDSFPLGRGYGLYDNDEWSSQLSVGLYRQGQA